LNMESGEKEVKLMDKDDVGDANGVIVKSDVEELVENSPLLTRAVDQVLRREFDVDTLEEVAEYSHEGDFGERIARSGLSVELFRVLVNRDYSAENRELCARIFGATFKNNPDSQKLLFDVVSGDGKVISKLLDALKAETDDKMKSRLLYVLGSLMTHPRGMDEFIEVKGNSLLRDIFAKGSSSLRSKCLIFVWDHVLHSPVLQDNKWYKNEMAYWSDALQNALTRGNGELNQEMFETLVKITELDGQLPIKKDFLKWLSKKNDEGLKKRNRDDEFYQLVRQARHTVFGNPNAERKHNAEEL
jgi:hypothetical protein